MLCGAIIIATFIWYRYKVSHDKPVDRKLIVAVFAMECVGLWISIGTYMTDKEVKNGRLEKPEVGQMTEKVTADYGNGKEDSFEIVMDERVPDKKEIAGILAGAIREIDDSFLADNESLDQVVTDVCVKEQYQNGKVIADWYFEPAGLVGSNGAIDQSQVTERKVVTARAGLSCLDQYQEYRFDFQICPLGMETSTGRHMNMERLIKSQQEQFTNQDYVILPEQIDGNKVIWKRSNDRKGEKLSLLAVLMGLLCMTGKRRDQSRRNKERERELNRDYPRIVSDLSTYLAAGVSVKNAMGRMAADYQNRRERGGKRQEGYEEISLTVRQMKDGMGELKAYEEMGRRCRTKYYRKLVLLLNQNLRQGTARLTEILEQEEEAANDLRIIQAKMAGEEASTKLLIPLVGLLGMIIIILVIPAFIQLT